MRFAAFCLMFLLSDTVISLSVMGCLQQIAAKRPPVEDVVDAVIETLNTRFTCKRKLEELAK